jgi:hypothetical protein
VLQVAVAALQQVHQRPQTTRLQQCRALLREIPLQATNVLIDTRNRQRYIVRSCQLTGREIQHRVAFAASQAEGHLHDAGLVVCILREAAQRKGCHLPKLHMRSNPYKLGTRGGVI